MQDITQIIKANKKRDIAFAYVGVLCLSFSLLTLIALIGNLAVDGLGRIDMEFLTSFPSRFADRAGIYSAWVGSIAVMLVTASFGIPVGVAAAIYLEEYAPKNKVSSLIELNISNLAGVPSIVYGLLALGVFVHQLAFGQSILTAGLTLGLLILPIIIVTSREAIRAIPHTIREAAFAVGATKWQTTRDHVLPYSIGGIMTGIIIALSRAIGETAPLVTIGALSFIAFLPPTPIQSQSPYLNMEWLSSPFTVMPIQMFNWVSRPQQEFHINAAAAGLILVTMAMVMNAGAVMIRNRYRKKIKW
jgi:phosphate transport system permease protein